jgi:hypothetical protein
MRLTGVHPDTFGEPSGGASCGIDRRKLPPDRCPEFGKARGSEVYHHGHGWSPADEHLFPLRYRR